MESYVNMSLKEYDELKDKAKRFDRLKEKFGDDLDKVLDEAIKEFEDMMSFATKNKKSKIEVFDMEKLYGQK